jgi:hypothetical protein
VEEEAVRKSKRIKEDVPCGAFRGVRNINIRVYDYPLIMFILLEQKLAASVQWWKFIGLICMD